MPNHPKTTDVNAFKGLNNNLRPERTDINRLKEAMNIDIDRDGGLHKRPGYTEVDDGSYTALYANDKICYAIRGGDLVRIYQDYSFDTVTTSLGTLTASFETLEGENEVYYTSPERSGVLSGSTTRPYGISRPNPSPILTQGTGLLDPGTYQISITYVSTDGRESGAALAQYTLLTTPKSIILSGIPASPDPTVDTVRVYCSTPNGEVLYLVQELTNGTSTTTIADPFRGVVPLRSFGIYTPPNGHILREGHGRMWIAEDNYLWYSEPYAYEWFRLQSNFLPFESRIRAVMPTEGGVWVGTDRLYYLAGKDPNAMRQKEVEPVKCVEGTDIKILGTYIFIENTPIGYKWLVTTDRGMYICFNDGIALNMTEQQVSLPKADQGTGIFLQQDGINRYLSILQQKKESNNLAVGDLATATIIRNGITI